MKKRGHSLQQLLPLCLLTVFVLSAVLAVLLCASVYRQILDRSDRLTGGVALTYIGEKVRQSDVSGAVRQDRIGSCPALVIRQGEEVFYDTYIYCYDGALRELMIKCELTPAPEMGRALIPLEGLEITLEEGLLQLTCVDSSGEVRESLIALRSEEGR